MMKLLTLTIISCHLVSVYSNENNIQEPKNFDNQDSEISKRPFFGKLLKLQHLNRALAEEALDENEENPLEFEVFPNLVIPNKRSNSHLFLRTSKRPFFGKLLKTKLFNLPEDNEEEEGIEIPVDLDSAENPPALSSAIPTKKSNLYLRSSRAPPIKARILRSMSGRIQPRILRSGLFLRASKRSGLFLRASRDPENAELNKRDMFLRTSKSMPNAVLPTRITKSSGLFLRSS